MVNQTPDQGCLSRTTIGRPGIPYISHAEICPACPEHLGEDPAAAEEPMEHSHLVGKDLSSFPKKGRASRIPVPAPATKFRGTGLWAWYFLSCAAPANALKPWTRSTKSNYFFFAAGALSGIAMDIGVDVPAASSCFTDSEILSAFFTNTATCQICVSVNCPLNPGIPDKRMPFSTFQYDSHGSSSVTPVP